MKKNITSFIVGFIFAIGLGISGMTQPLKVMSFLDITGAFDPSLMFVMVGAIAVHFLAYRLIRKKSSPVFEREWMIPTSKELTPSLITGSFIFGIGWALGGFCPGPAITSLASLEIRPLLFVISMIGGMITYKISVRNVK